MMVRKGQKNTTGTRDVTAHVHDATKKSRVLSLTHNFRSQKTTIKKALHLFYARWPVKKLDKTGDFTQHTNVMCV